jgi:hypothetical protein
MNRILTSVVLVVLLFPALALGETMDDLVITNGLLITVRSVFLAHKIEPEPMRIAAGSRLLETQVDRLGLKNSGFCGRHPAC